MNRLEKLAKLREINNPQDHSLNLLAEKIERLVPKAGKDYFTPAEIDAIVNRVRSLIKDGEKGDKGEKGDSIVGPQGIPGKDGRDGETPNLDEIVTKALRLIPKPKDGTSPDIKDIVSQAVEELKKMPSEDGLRLTALEKRLIRLGGGGASFLSQLGDVALNNPTDLQVLGYNAVLGKWENQTNAAGTGINRVITSIAVNANAGSVALTDYVYLVSGTTTITLPTAVGNNNRYTIKRVGSGVVTIDTTGGATIDGSATAPLNVQYESLDLISDGTNWNVI